MADELLALNKDHGLHLRALATALVVHYLEIKLKESRDTWELMAEKARSWLEEHLLGGGLQLEELLQETKKVLVTGGNAFEE